MDLDYLNILPQWEDDNFNNEEGEEWKTQETRAAGKALYLQWRELFELIVAFAENLSDDGERDNRETHERFTKKLIYENAMIIAPKIISATRINMYVLQMENAAIIRVNCRQLMEQVGFAVLMGFGDESHKEVIGEAMNDFRLLFLSWIASFQKDEFQDEWGLFI